MEKLKELLLKCKCGVFLSVNAHRDHYETAEPYLEDAKGRECPPRIGDDVRRGMIETNTIMVLQFYPDTPISSYEIWHHDLDVLIEEALSCF